MADNERLRKNCPPRRNPQQTRPTPGVQKAIQAFGVRDLREILDKKRQEQGESQGDKRPDPKLVKLPPPDPSYNYLKDPARDAPRSPQKKPDQERPIPRDRGTNSQQYHNRDERASFRDRDRENYSRQEKWLNNNRDTRQQERKDTRQLDRDNHSTVQEKGVLKKNFAQSEGAPKKELRFSDTPVTEEQTQEMARSGRRNFRGRGAKRGGGMPREEKIENPFNIKIELSTETGQRNVTVDESSKIADIKHVPDKFPRGGYRGGRGNFRSRGRGRGSFRGKGAFSYRGRGTNSKIDVAGNEQPFNMEKLQESLPDVAAKDDLHLLENGNTKSNDVNTMKETNKDNIHETTAEEFEEVFEQYDEYDHDNEEYNDANENYEEFSNEYYSEYQDNAAELDQNLDSSGVSENSQGSERYGQGEPDILDPNLKATITITSSKFQDGGVQRSIEVSQKSNEEEKKKNDQAGKEE